MPGPAVRIAGVDLAASPERTGWAVLELSSLPGPGCPAARGRVVGVGAGLEDEALLTLLASVSLTGVDVPFGWPRAFTGLLAGHGEPPPEALGSGGAAWRRRVTLRRTDRLVTERTGQRPLSVAADMIAHPALRWAAVAAEARRRGVAVPPEGPVDPAGGARACEVYPAGALRVWGLPHRGYKRAARDAAAPARAEILAGLRERHPGLDLGPHVQDCLDSDDVLDALLAAVIAACVAGGAALPPAPGEELDDARSEGWIWLPQTHDGADRSG